MSGKGGVGKTTMAAALALLAAERGQRTLVCEVDPKGDLAASYECGPTRFKPSELQPGLWAMSMNTEESLREYLSLFLRIPVAGRIGPLARAFDFVATAAPGVKEILTVGKLCYEVRENHYDLVVVDASATGHIIGQLAAPQGINEVVHVGLVSQQTGWMLDILSDPELTGLCIVATPEEMPVNETVELAARVQDETTVELAAVIVNRVLPELFTRSEEDLFETLCEPEVAARIEKDAGGEPGPILAAARLAVTMRRTRAAHLDRLRQGIDAAVPLLYVPYLFTRAHGVRALRQVASALSAELGL
ncbi:MAG TPA: ArsA family ATPase [Acidimicrobiales bacterium]|nr:ArsA family ATPase [Acidimicrobiales bacterium]